jgi:hypothetical protein
MSTEKEKRKQKIIAVVKEFTNPKHRKLVMEGMKYAEEAQKTLKNTEACLKQLEMEVNRGNIDKAEKLYKKLFVNTGKFRIKRAVSERELKAFLNDKSLIKKVLGKTRKAHAYIKAVVPKCRMVVDAYDKICKLSGAFADVEKLRMEQKKLSSPGSYVSYYNEIAKGFSSASSVMKEITGKLPPGASDYCDFIFSVAENTAKAAKVVGDYTTKLINAFSAFDSLQKSLEKRGVKAGDVSKFDDKHDRAKSINDELDLKLGNPSRKR